MANTPNPKSYETILGEMLSTYMSKIGVNDLNTGSAVSSFFEAMAQSVYGATGGVFSTLRDFSVDRATGESLKRIAAEENIKLEKARVATGKVNFTDTSFNKISSKIYAGAIAPNAGSTEIKVSDASLFGDSGQIYIGRGTGNIEGPINYISKTPVGGYWVLSLSLPTVKFHNLSESVILAQGGVRNIPTGTVVKAPSSGGSPDILFKTTRSAIILDGEITITNIEVAADEPGVGSNVSAGSITSIGGTLFNGASVTNNEPFITGKNEDTDEEIRTKIKKARISKGLGTVVAIKNATLGAQAVDENARVTSNEMFSDIDSATLFIDNGDGYEQKTSGIGLEYIVDSALGGETRFQLSTGGQQTSIAKAFLESSFDGPYSVNPNDRLAILVGDILNEHVFSAGNFRSNGNATAYELAASINANPNITFIARTANGGKRISIEAKSESSEYLQITTPTVGNDAGITLGFTANEVQTLRLYKNRKPLNRNGKKAIVESADQTNWLNLIASGDTLIISVDGTSPITCTITNEDFLKEGSYSTVSKTNSLESWINVLNTKLTGVTVSIHGNRLMLISNLGNNPRAQIDISISSTLVSKGMFVSSIGLSSTGAQSDFTLSRNTAQFKLNSPLSAGDSLTAGTEFNRASVSSSPILGGNITFSKEANLWFLVDKKDAFVVNSGINTGALITVSKESDNIIRYTTNITGAFSNIVSGDYVIIWSEELNINNRLEGRVHSKTNTTFDLKITPNEYSNAVAEPLVLFKEGLVFARTSKVPQKINFSIGSYDINTIASLIQSNLLGVSSYTSNDEIITINTNTNDLYGSILVVTFNDSAKGMGFVSNALGESTSSHFAFQESTTSDADYPLFIHSKITSDEYANVPSSLITEFTSQEALDEIYSNEYISILNPYSSSDLNIKDAQSKNEFVQIDSLSANTINIDQNKLIRRLRADDRYFVASGFNFSHNDFLIAVLNEDPVNETFPIPLYRKAKANNTYNIDKVNFRAYDSDSGDISEFLNNFGDSYSFKNYKVLMQARNVIDPIGLVNEDAILFRSVYWGLSGERFSVGYGYPTSSNQDIKHNISTNENKYIKILLKSGNPVDNKIDSTTEWNVTVTPSVGFDQVTYTWSLVGRDPEISGLLSGNYVTINNAGEFNIANIGTFRISSATATSFTVNRPNGIAIPEVSISNGTNNTISLYENSDTTALDIVSYVNSSLSDFLTANLIEDNGITGSGIIKKSTYENSSFSDESIPLVDGINYLAYSDLSALSPNHQFSFKNPLVLEKFNTNTTNAYTFTNGEEIRFIPTNAKQINDLISILAVSGFTTLGDIDTSERNGKLQLKTKILGSSGALQITGGSANSALALVLGTSSPIDTNFIESNITRSSASGFQAGQFTKITASNLQKKETGISGLTSVSISPNTIISNKTVIELLNKEDQDRYFGQPRSAFRDLNRAFHVEKHGKLVCISWDEITGLNPLFSKTVEINKSNGDVINVEFYNDLKITKYKVISGTTNFNEVQCGDLININGSSYPSNDGNFKVLGISSDKKTISINNTKGITTTSSTNEKQTINFENIPTSGNFKLNFDGQTTLDIPFSANAATIESELELLSNITDVLVSGDFQNGFDIEFQGINEDSDVPLMSISDNTLDAFNSQIEEYDFTGLTGSDFDQTQQIEIYNFAGLTGSNLGITRQVENYDLTGLNGSSFDTAGSAKYFQFGSDLAYLWFKVTDGLNTQTIPAGNGTPIQVNVLNADNAETIANKIKTAINDSFIFAKTTWSTTSPITLTSISNGSNRNGNTINLVVNAEAANPTNSIIVNITGSSSAITISITPNNGVHNAGTHVTITTAQVVELINYGSVSGKNITLSDSSNLRIKQKAIGGGIDSIIAMTYTGTFSGSKFYDIGSSHNDLILTYNSGEINPDASVNTIAAELTLITKGYNAKSIQLGGKSLSTKSYLWFDVTDDINIQTVPSGNGTAIRVPVLNADNASALAIRANTALSLNLNKKERFYIVALSGSQITGGQYFNFDLPNSGTKYYGWFNNGSSVDPAPAGRTGVEFNYNNGNDEFDIAQIITDGLNTITGLTASYTFPNEYLEVEFNDYGPAIDAENINYGGGSYGVLISITQQGYLTDIHSSTQNSSGILTVTYNSGKIDDGSDTSSGSSFSILQTGCNAKSIQLGNSLAYLWFKVTDGLNTQTIPAGNGTPIQVNVLNADNASVLATKTNAVMGIISGILNHSANLNILNITYNSGSVAHGYDINTGILFTLLQKGVSSGIVTVIITESLKGGGTGTFTITTTVEEGDSVKIGDPFDILNQGSFRVIRKYNNSIYIDNPLAVEEGVLIEENLRILGFDSSTQFDITNNGNMRLTWNGSGTQPTLENAKMGDILNIGTAFDILNQGSFMVTKSTSTYIECANSQAIAEFNIQITKIGTDFLTAHTPSMIFSPYENTIIGDSLTISGSVLNSSNAGTYFITEVLDQERIVIENILTIQNDIPLGTNFEQVYIKEGLPYVGYKKIYNAFANPDNSNNYKIVFDTSAQYQKINEIGACSISALGKLGFSEINIRGLDSYRYHGGLIQQVNKIVYGDPRDNTTYPGVAAAGAEIFIEPPLFRRIEISINVRVKTGIPFNRIAEQVKNNIASLINSTAIGQPIAISNIISVTNAISGVTAVSISSPSYSPSSDVIAVAANEKPLIIDISSDITVSKVG